MGINFPSSPADGQVFNASPGVSFVARSGRWKPAPLKTALPKNYLMNGGMGASQERESVTNPLAASSYLCDQWFINYVGPTGIQASRTVLSPAPTPNGTPTVAGIYFGTVLAAPAAGDYFHFTQPIEGIRMADLLYGTALAMQTVLSFRVFCQIAGTYCVNIRNGAADRSWIGTFTISAGETASWQTRTVVIPGDTTGTWTNDSARGCTLGFTLLAGTTGQGALGWQAGIKYGVAGQVNAAAAVGWNVFFGDIGLYADPYLTGVAPPFEIPPVVDETSRCKRYWYKAFGARGVVVSAAVLNSLNNIHPVPMRAKPTVSLFSGALVGYDCSTTPVISSISTAPCNSWALELNTGTSGLIAARPGGHIWGGTGTPANNCFAVSSRF